MNETEDQAPARHSSSEPRNDKKSSLSLRGFTLGGVVILVTFCAAAYFVQAWMAEDVDPTVTQPVVINDKVESPSQSGEDSVANLPEGAITAMINQRMIDQAKHPFEPLMKIAQLSIAEIDTKYRDYTATLVSQVRVDGELEKKKYIFCKILHAGTSADSDPEQSQVPFSVYTKFLAPKSVVGQEAIWVEGQNDGKIIAHPTGLLNVKRVYLDPDGSLAMGGNRYPIYMIGFRNLLVKMVELGEKAMKHGECSVAIKRGVEINDRICTTLEVVHPNKRDHFDFHIARISIDDELNIPIAYEGFLWPEQEGGPPVLIERYVYTELKLNVGLTADDFDPGNKEYKYPAW